MKDKKRFLKISKKKIIIGVFSLVLIIGIIATFLGRGGNEEPLVSTITLERGLIEKSLSVTGKIQGTDSAEISSALPYEIISINVKEGDYVRRGDILASLDDKDLKREIEMAKRDYELSVLQSRESLQSDVDTSVKAQEIQLEQSILDREEALRQLDIKRKLYESGGIPLEDLRQSEMAFERANIAVELSQETLRKTKFEIQRAIDQSRPRASIEKSLEIKREILRQKEEDLERLKIKSPIDGTVTRVNARIGRTAQNTDGNRPMFVIENLSDLRLMVNISEFDIASIAYGQEVNISSDILSGEFIKGYVSRVSPTGEPRDQSSREMVIPVEIKINEADPRLIAGVSAQGKILIDKKESVFKIPFEALLEEFEETYVLVVREGIVQKVKVDIGIEGDMNVEIISSELNVGDEIILNPSSELEEGMKVRLSSGQEIN